MFTIRQLQAFYWAARLESFGEAGDQLNISQSALSKRVADLESVMGREMFDRSNYRPALTSFGRAMLEPTALLLASCDEMLRLGRMDQELVGNLAFGLTEVVAMTWLPDAVAKLRALHPRVVLEPHIDRASDILPRIRKGSISLAILPLVGVDDVLQFTKVDDVELTLMASPTLLGGERFDAQQITRFPVMMQAAGSRAAATFDEWAGRHQLKINKVLATNSTTAIAQMVLAGVGVGFLPRGLFRPLVNRGRLVELSELPPALVAYYSVRRKAETSELVLAVEQLFATICDFKKSSYAENM